jgi:hypothetical protein
MIKKTSVNSKTGQVELVSPWEEKKTGVTTKRGKKK